MKRLFNMLADRLRSPFTMLRKKKDVAVEPEGEICIPEGYEILQNGRVNKGTAFSRTEREAKGLRGLLPYSVDTEEIQKERALENLRRKQSDIEKYTFLSDLHDHNERLFYQLVKENIDEIMPLIYTPTVGEACKDFSRLFSETRGLYITPDDKGSIREILDNWPEDDVRVIVMTDGERILGLGDLGANGMGISIGKLALYTGFGGIDPDKCMPVMFDIGTKNMELRDDPLYLGYPHERLKGAAYFELMDEFITAIQDKFPKAMIQFEDFLAPNAFELLDKYRDKITCFNDDIQGTAAVSLAGVYAGARASGQKFEDLRIMFLGAGSAATGIGDLMVSALQETGMSEDEARKRLSFVDSKGLVTTSRKDELAPHKKPYAQDYDDMDLAQAIAEIKPHVLIGATGSAGSFTQEIIELMSDINERPIIFALSNPTSHAECTAEQAYEWSRGQALFASGSPFDPVEYDGKTYRPGQGNNAYIFPGVGLGVMCAEIQTITDEMFLAVAKELSELVTDKDLQDGSLYPPLKDIACVSSHIAKAVIEKAVEQKLTQMEMPKDLVSFIAKEMYDPSYGGGIFQTSKPSPKRRNF